MFLYLRIKSDLMYSPIYCNTVQSKIHNYLTSDSSKQC